MSIEIIQDLINRYKALLKSGRKNPYYATELEWRTDLKTKIVQLETSTPFIKIQIKKSNN